MLTRQCIALSKQDSLHSRGASARSPLEITKRKLVESMKTTCEFSDALLRCNSHLGVGNKGGEKNKKKYSVTWSRFVSNVLSGNIAKQIFLISLGNYKIVKYFSDSSPVKIRVLSVDQKSKAFL